MLDSNEEKPDEMKVRTIAKARAEIATGQGVAHDEVIEWLKSWGTPNELSRPKPGRH